jgi:hypothetical protein
MDPDSDPDPKVLVKELEAVIRTIPGGLSGVFEAACAAGRQEVVTWLLGLLGPETLDMTEAFSTLWRRGHVSFAKTLWDFVDPDTAFQDACEANLHDMATWVMEHGEVDVKFCNDDLFQHALWYNHLSMATRLYGMGGVDLHANYDHGFRWCCHRGWWEAANLLVRQDPGYAWTGLAGWLGLQEARWRGLSGARMPWLRALV